MISFTLLLLIGATLTSANTDARFEILPQIKAPLNHFWESTGLCPPQPHQSDESYLLSDSMVQNLLLISSVPHQGIKQVRIHWLLDLIKYDSVKSAYDFKYLDRLVQLFFENNLLLGFELMGSPSGRFTDFDNSTQLAEYANLVTEIASRYVQRYGLDYVSRWKFETWNEPDHKDYDDVVMTVPGFLKYYEASAEALDKVSSKLAFGGPGGSCRSLKFSKRCWALMEHCAKKETLFTSGKSSEKCKLDYISFHKKGLADAGTIMAKELVTIRSIQENYPSLSHVPIVNDEADPLVGWSRPQDWRADNRYAALVVKVLAQHQNLLIANSSRTGINYSLLSNDNGFLNYHPYYFEQRSLNARFQINNTSPNYVHFVRKPVLAAMLLLAKLSDHQLVMLPENASGEAQINGIASINKEQHYIATVLYNSLDSDPKIGESKVTLSYRKFDVLLLEMMMFYKLNPVSMICYTGGNETDPFSVWVNKLNSPVFPSPEELKLLHSAEGPVCDQPQLWDVSSLLKGGFDITINLPLPGVALHQLCLVEGPALPAPMKLQAYSVTRGQVLLKWDDSSIPSKCIQTYEIHFKSDYDDVFTPIVNKNLLFTSFYYINDKDGVNGLYKIRAVDMWGKAGQFSTIIHFPPAGGFRES